MIDGIILAAGRSSRAGVFKPAYLHEGVPLLLHAIDGLRPWCERVVVVAGHRCPEVVALMADRPWVRLAINRNHDDGMFSSVQVGVKALSRRLRGFFVLPVDCPLVSSATAVTMIDTFWIHDARRIVIPEHDGRGGHPVLLPADLRRDITRAAVSTTLRDVIRGHQSVRVPVAEPSVLLDLDTPDDLQALARGGSA